MRKFVFKYLWITVGLVHILSFSSTAQAGTIALTSGTTIRVTQGETVVLAMTATANSGSVLDLTAATFTTYINGPKGAVNAFANSKHAIVTAASGTFTLTLTAADTGLLLVGTDREIVTKITQGSNVTVMRGSNILSVLPLFPLR